VVKRTGRRRGGAAAHGVEACVVKKSRKRGTREERTGWRRLESGGGVRAPRGKGVGRAETSRVRQLPNDGVVSARVRIDMGSWPRKIGEPGGVSGFQRRPKCTDTNRALLQFQAKTDGDQALLSRASPGMGPEAQTLIGLLDGIVPGPKRQKATRHLESCFRKDRKPCRKLKDYLALERSQCTNNKQVVRKEYTIMYLIF
jgi:hypothetical protein